MLDDSVDLENNIPESEETTESVEISDSDISITLDDMDNDAEHVPRVIQGSLFTAARGQESDVNITLYP